MEVRVTGVEDLTRRLRRYGVQADRAMDISLRKAAEDTRNEAIKGIQRGPNTGRVYPPVAGRRGTAHQASAPGQYPATDTGRLVSSVRTVRVKDSDYAVGTALEYGAHLEFGTVDMAERPWLFPSVQKAIPALRRRLQEALRRLGRGR